MRQPSLDDVAVAVGLPAATLFRRSTKEGWVAQREAFRRRQQEEESTRLIQALADQAARVRTAYFRTSMRGQQRVEEQLIQGANATDLNALMGALAKAQGVTDLAIYGPKALQAPQVGIQVNAIGWPALAQRPAAPILSVLSTLDQE